MNKQLRADLMLVIVTLCWGASFYLIDISLKEVGIFSLLAFRFMLAFIIVFTFFFKKLTTVNLITIRYALISGFFLTLTYFMSVTSVANTSVTNASFLCAMSVVFTPILAFFIKKHIPSKKFIFVIITCTIGMALLTLSDNLTIAIGDLYGLMCAIAFSLNLLVTESAVKKEGVNPFQMGVFMLGVVGTVMTVLAFTMEKPSLPKTPQVWFAMLFLAIFSTAVATILQVIAQQHTTANHVGIIYTLEPIFSSVIAYIFAGEVLLLRGYIGATLMILSILVMEIDFTKIKILNDKKE